MLKNHKVEEKKTENKKKITSRIGVNKAGVKVIGEI
jgi:hypothetical protein